MPRILLSLLLVPLLAAFAAADSIRVGAAVSLREAFDTLAKTYQADTGDTVEFVYGSSGQIAAQIKAGAPVDAFVSAANKQVDDLSKAGLLDASTRRTVAGNKLVLIAPKTSSFPKVKAFADLANARRVAIGEPKTVPAGQYAAQVLTALQLTDKLDGRLVYGSSVRQVLAYVERGEVAAGLVYATDAAESGDKVVLVATADEKTHEPIVYPAAVVAAGTHRDAAKRFLDYLSSAKGRAALTARGFTLPNDPARP